SSDDTFSTHDGTATAADCAYSTSAAVLHFNAHYFPTRRSSDINGDTKAEPNETFNVVLSNATSGATISDGSGLGIISNDDAAPGAGSIAINDHMITKGNSGRQLANFTVTRTGGTAAFAVNFGTT